MLNRTLRTNGVALMMVVLMTVAGPALAAGLGPSADHGSAATPGTTTWVDTLGALRSYVVTLGEQLVAWLAPQRAERITAGRTAIETPAVQAKATSVVDPNG